jgi:hypothetical protein
MPKQVFAALLLTLNAFAQKVGHTASFRDMEATRYFRVNYDNDFFGSSDRYYTQGVNLELVAEGLGANPISHLLIKPKTCAVRYGLSLEHIAFTPSNILTDDIRPLDRPFAAAAYLKSFAMATDTLHRSRWVSAFSMGVMGPAAGGGELQRWIHEWTTNPKPLGWQHQIRNDVIVQYEIAYEKELLRLGTALSVQGGGTAKAGSLFTHFSANASIMVGRIGNPFGRKSNRRFFLYGFMQPMVTAVGYDVTLQGGLFNDKSPHTVSEKDIERLTAQNNYGVVLRYHWLYAEFFQTMLTREFKTGRPHRFGGVKIGFSW